MFYIVNPETFQVLHKLAGAKNAYAWHDSLYNKRAADLKGRTKIHSRPCAYKTIRWAMKLSEKVFPDKERHEVMSMDYLRSRGYYDENGRLMI